MLHSKYLYRERFRYTYTALLFLTLELSPDHFDKRFRILSESEVCAKVLFYYMILKKFVNNCKYVICSRGEGGLAPFEKAQGAIREAEKKLFFSGPAIKALSPPPHRA